MNLFRGYRAWRRLRSAEMALNQMSDSQLSDLGIKRGEIRSAVRGR